MKLTARRVATLKAPGMHSDGGGLYLRIRASGGRSWILRTRVHGRKRDIGLGSAELVPLAEAREKARQLRKVARAGGDPIADRQGSGITFAEAARRVHAHGGATWSSSKHGRIWWRSLELHALPRIGQREIGTVTGADVLEVLTPIWTETPDTARRVRQRMAAIFDWAKGAGHYHGENPVHAIRRALPAQRARVKHMTALPWQEIPAFMAELRQREALSARTLEFLILTACRSGEVRGATWAEIDSDTWTIPAERMKARAPHRVPLSPRAVAVIEAVRGLDRNLIFPSVKSSHAGKPRPPSPQSDAVFAALFRRLGRPELTAHGFRTSFRTWASDAARADREVAEAALAHQTGNEVERAYARSDLLDRRRPLMEAWGEYCLGGQP